MFFLLLLTTPDFISSIMEFCTTSGVNPQILLVVEEIADGIGQASQPQLNGGTIRNHFHNILSDLLFYISNRDIRYFYQISIAFQNHIYFGNVDFQIITYQSGSAGIHLGNCQITALNSPAGNQTAKTGAIHISVFIRRG